jgi:hypothetical protein
MKTCNYIGNPPMFHSRVSGVGGSLGNPSLPKKFENIACIGPNCQMDGGFRLQVCPPVCPEGYVPPSERPPTIPMVEPAKPSGSALPLVIGAALLLLS